jgi:3-methylcrotonyl-CoA carboxylase alpha subunit
MEARLYAEDPAKGFLPSVGPVDHWIIPEPHDINVRVESGLNRTDTVSQFYDPMIAKIVVHAEDRPTVIRQLAQVCSSTEVAPVKTNAGFLTRLLQHPEFKEGAVTTGFIGSHETELCDNGPKLESLKRDAAMALLIQGVQPLWGTSYGTVNDELESVRKSVPWRQAVGFRLNRPPEYSASFFLNGERQVVLMTGDWRNEWVSTERAEGGLHVFEDGECLTIATRIDSGTHHHASDGAILSPMPGRIIAVEVAAGDAVVKGQKLLTLEAMKMEHSLTAPFDGVVAELNAVAGGQVQVEALLVRIEAA